ncbi:pyridoxal phosphate-dependent aminotransferase, partial [Mesorhizobium sp. M4A.F.Ca.ET.022.05.2.1]
KERVGVMPGSSFGEAAAGHIRVSLCQPEPILKEAALRLRRFASAYRREAA